jgi:hypothetical protein
MGLLCYSLLDHLRVLLRHRLLHLRVLFHLLALL